MQVCSHAKDNVSDNYTSMSDGLMLRPYCLALVESMSEIEFKILQKMTIKYVDKSQSSNESNNMGLPNSRKLSPFCLAPKILFQIEYKILQKWQ